MPAEIMSILCVVRAGTSAEKAVTCKFVFMALSVATAFARSTMAPVGSWVEVSTKVKGTPVAVTPTVTVS